MEITEEGKGDENYADEIIEEGKNVASKTRRCSCGCKALIYDVSCYFRLPPRELPYHESPKLLKARKQILKVLRKLTNDRIAEAENDPSSRFLFPHIPH